MKVKSAYKGAVFSKALVLENPGVPIKIIAKNYYRRDNHRDQGDLHYIPITRPE
jgi:hypothetical protein